MASETVHRPQWRIYAMLGGAALAVYLGTYVGLSLQGRYEAIFWGLGHVKARAWIPRGFETDGEWNVGMVYAFFPVYHLDRKYWHTDGEADSGRYPVNSDDYYMYGKPAQTNPVPGQDSN